MMKKYLKKLAASYTYKFSSPWKIGFEQIIWIFDNEPQEIKEELYPSEVDSDIYDTAVEMIENSFNDDAEMMAQVLYDQYKVPTELSIKVNDDNIITTLFTKKELSDDELKDFMDWFEGQCSDGWGEGLEQEELEHTTWEDEEAIENCEDVPQYASDCVDFEEWCKCEGYDIPEDEDSDEYNELYQEYEEAKTRAQVETYYNVSVWPKNFKMSKI